MDPVPLVEILAIVAEDVVILLPAAAGVVLHKLQADVEAGEEAAPEEEDAAGEDAGAAFLLKLKVEIKTQSTRGLQQPAGDVEQRENALVRPGEDISLSGLSLDEFTLPSRPSFGTNGRQIVLRTNYFRVTTKPGAEIFRYEMGFSPSLSDPEKKNRTNRRKTRRLVELLFINNPQLHGAGFATDYSKFIVTAQKLPLQGREIELQQRYYEAEESGPRPNATNYKITISNERSFPIQQLLDYISSPPGVTSAGFDKSEIIQVLNIVMTRTANQKPNIYGGGDRNKFYDYPVGERPYDNINLGKGLIFLKGFYTSIRTSTLRVLVNINVANAAFYPAMNLLGLMQLHTGNLAQARASGLEGFIRLLKVSHNYIDMKKPGDPHSGVKRVKTVQGFSRPNAKVKFPIMGNANTIKFRCEELNPPREITVSAYFKQKYKVSLQKPNDPCINVGTVDKPSFIPPELLTVEPGQQYRKRLNEQQTRQMIAFAVRRPAENARRIVEVGAPMMGLSENNTNLVTFGIKVLPSMITVRGRILPAGSVQYKVGNILKPFPTRGGSWDVRDRAFSDGKHLRNWGFIKFANNEINRADVEQFRKILGACGMRSDEPLPPNGFEAFLERGEAEEVWDQKIQQGLKEAHSRGVKILLVILPDANAFVYSRIKFYAENKAGIHTVCSVGMSFREKNKNKPNYWANIAHKFNLKLGGINQSLARDRLGPLSDGKAMLVGMDVTHPSPGSVEGAPSIAGVVASIDGHYGQWPASMRAQKSKQEMIAELHAMFKERLTLWEKHNRGALPERIIIYRDGVSEGQYRTLLHDELPQVRAACKEKYAGGRSPQISIIVCGKRHHTRFYPTNEKDADMYNGGNPLSGTVVDRGVTMEKGWDFFLQAHSALQGTAKPTHYVIIHDENGMKADQMEAMSDEGCVTLSTRLLCGHSV
ncbi:MAG: hypothetical protein LQ345_001405 [Seirophora villosa]|nr:MAG: hypothetical protein LQ345_001405 [Seirophora villosa]